MTTLRDIIAGMEASGDDLLMEAPTDWFQGRTLYGGMTGALSVAAARRKVSDLPPLRSAQITFVGPAAGPLRFTPLLVRQGRSATIMTVDCWAGDALAARTNLIFGAARESAVVHDRLERPDVPRPEACKEFGSRDLSKRPAFTLNFEMRHAAGAWPLTPGAEPEMAMWVRLLDAEGVDADVAMLALGDCLPPAAIIAFPQMAPISSMNWTVDFGHMPDSGAGWHLLTTTSEQSGEGYSLQPMGLWSADGRRIAGGRQVVAIFV